MKEKSLTIEGIKNLVKKTKETKELVEKDKNVALAETTKKTKALATTKKAKEEKPKKESKKVEKKETVAKKIKKEEESAEKEGTKKIAKKAATKTSTKKADEAKVVVETPAKAETKTATKSTKKATATKKTTVKKETGIKKSVATKKTAATKKASTTKKSTTIKTKKTPSKTTKKSTKTLAREVTISVHANEYFDLPYRYNETIVKLLAQTPKRLFVYWDISDVDRENYTKHFGDEFFYKTVPFLKIVNETKNYSFDVEINDFANSWYIDINDDDCKYSIELYRKYREHELNEDIINILQSFNNSEDNYIFVATSNKMDAPNGKVVSLEYPRTIEFKNMKTNEKSYKVIEKPQIADFYATFYSEEFDAELRNLPSSR